MNTSLHDISLNILSSCEQERGRLRHTGGKFAREAKIFAKYDDEVRFNFD